MRYFFQHAEFITGRKPYTEGFLYDKSMQAGYLAFLRLLGTVYYKKNATAFATNSPEVHFKTFYTAPDAGSLLDVHYKWLEDIRQAIWDRISTESDMLPSGDALQRHWMRSWWILDMWGQASQNTLQLEDMFSYGWKLVDGKLAIDWDSAQNITRIQQRVTMLTKGCKCKTGCGSSRCGCRKKGRNCLEGCSCQHCTNLSSPPGHSSGVEHLEREENELTDEDSDCGQ